MVKKMATPYSGTIAIKEGTITLINDKPEAGKFIIDATSVKMADNRTNAISTAFNTYLASEYFLSPGQFPVAVFEIIYVSPKGDAVYNVEGNLTIKGITGFVSFDANISVKGDVLNATARFVIDRKKYKMRFYRDNFLGYLKDTFISSTIEVEINIFAKAPLPLGYKIFCPP
jgi:polyisoprenoid-binding protein YceI